MTTYTVVKGDCLWAIASKQLGDPYKWTALADVNGISRDNPVIYVGQVLNLDISGSSTTPTTPTTNTSSKPEIQYFGLVAGTERSIFIVWTWDKDNTENYRVRCLYDTGQGIWFVGSDSTTEEKQYIYSMPNEAKRIAIKVKAISKTREVNDVETSYWTSDWSTNKYYSASDLPPKAPNTPTVTIENLKLTAVLDGLDINATSVQFQIVKDNASTPFSTGTATISTSHCEYVHAVTAGGEYKVRCRGVRGSEYGEWSSYSQNVGTQPSAIGGITEIKASSETSVYLAWGAVRNAKTYDIEYATKASYFDGSNQTTVSSNIEFTHYELSGLESGQRYFFRIRAVNANGTSPWSGIKSIIIGKKPAAPTTWSSTTTCTSLEPVTLFWMHNSEDNSTQTLAQIEIYVGTTKTVKEINSTSEADDKKTSSLSLSTSSYTEGAKIQWRVRTAGVTKKYGEWSIQRVIDVYAPPTLSVTILNKSLASTAAIDSLPFYIDCTAGPTTQTALGYHISITAKNSYETTDAVGNFKMIKAGEEVFSKHFDKTARKLRATISAFSGYFENNIAYTVTVTVGMSSGLIATETADFTTAWKDKICEPDAEIGYNKETFSTYIRPFCKLNRLLLSGVKLGVYRREFDGTFTELAKELTNNGTTFINDPHPALDFARYRITATQTSTGEVSYYDLPPYPIQEKSVIIQWDEVWTNFDVTDQTDALNDPVWSGSLLKLPYNIDVADTHSPDVSLVNYIGRSHPVSYYGTQLGETASWSVEIPSSDKETLYALRRLAVWMGDVYVREPSGSGYWANITVTISQTHCSMTIPVTFDIKRVDGGA